MLLSAYGDAYSFGQGSSGALGHYSGRTVVPTPTKVESLAGIHSVSLGQSHSLLLDHRGSAWACGDNSEGQLGLGTPIQELAIHKRHKLAQTQRQQAALADKAAGVPGGGSFTDEWSTSSFRSLYASGRLLPLPIEGRAAELDTISRLRSSANEPQAREEGMPWSPLWGMKQGDDGPDGSRAGVLVNHPQPVGRDYHRFMLGYQSNLDEAQAQVPAFVSVATSPRFSTAVTVDGQLYVWGLGAVWQQADKGLSRTSPQPVVAPVQRALAERGGVTKAVAGLHFMAALTATGHVLLLPRHQVDGWSLPQLSSHALQPLQGVPFITDIAASKHHLILTDGQAVWNVADVATTGLDDTPCAPKLILRAPDIRKLVAGPASFGAITDAGAFYMWGRLLSSTRVASLARSLRLANVDQVMKQATWAGCGAVEPTLVFESGVAHAALGKEHALVVNG